MVDARHLHVGEASGGARSLQCPAQIDTSLTPRAHSPIPIVDNLVDWVADNMAAILKDREKKVG